MIDMMSQKTSQKVIDQAVQFLKNGELVAFPTETVYGLGADATNELALKRLFATKGRPTSHPVIVHLADFAQIFDWCEQVPESAQVLARRFWPGPLTMILKRSSKACDLVTGGQETIGVRMPQHPIALALLRAFGDGVAAPSANRFGRVSPTTAEDVALEFGDEVAMVIDGGACDVGIESTIVDLSGSSPRVLRPGMISAEELGAILHLDLERASKGAPSIRVPGSLTRHYATQTKLHVQRKDEILSAIAKPEEFIEQVNHPVFSVLSFADQPKIKGDGNRVVKWIKASDVPTEYARTLYRNLRALDKSGAKAILVEEPPNTLEWVAIRDRLARACDSPKS